MTKTDPRRLETNRNWRSANADYDRERCRLRYAAKREQELERKRLYYQQRRKPQDKTERFKDREKKSRRRAASIDGTLTAEQWREICARHDSRCAYCGGAPETLEMDHVVALSRGGTHTADNIVPACKPCNSAKGAR